MFDTQNIGMRNEHGEQIPLLGVQTEVKLDGLLARVKTTQHFINNEQHPIEAVFTFPLPMAAVLLKLSVKIGDRKLAGTVIEKSEAQESYEDAITDGDGAIMLQETDEGLYTMNVGNLRPSERASITFRYAEIQRWNDHTLRFMIPTVVAPRYGAPQMEPQQIPDVAIDAEHRCSLIIKVRGLLADAEFVSPTHDVMVSKDQESTIITPRQEEILMDRDFVLNITSKQKNDAIALLGRDGDDAVALALFHPRFSQPHSDSGRNLLLVIDCSGSMGGDSIAQARRALLTILESLRPQDRFNVIRFGSTHESFFAKMVEANEENRSKALRLANRLDADLGGTQMGDALRAAYAMAATEDGSTDLLLITDGEVWNSGSLLSDAKRSGVRVFTVGVGSSVAESVVRQLADTTGGACELVTPNEQMATAIVRHFQRITEPRAKDGTIRWPSEPLWRTGQELRTVFNGDTVTQFVGLPSAVEGEALFSGCINGERLTMGTATLTPSGGRLFKQDLARVAAAYRIRELGDCALSLQLALKYQLLTKQTHYLVIDQRELKQEESELPQLRKVPQMLAAGWGGMGTVSLQEPKMFFCRRTVAPAVESCNLDLPAFLQLKADTAGDNASPAARPSLFDEDENCPTIGDLIKELVEYLAEGNPLPISYKELEAMDKLGILDMDEFDLIEDGEFESSRPDDDSPVFTEQEIIAGFFNWLRKEGDVDGVMPRDVARRIRVVCKHSRKVPEVRYYRAVEWLQPPFHRKTNIACQQ